MADSQLDDTIFAMHVPGKLAGRHLHLSKTDKYIVLPLFAAALLVVRSFGSQLASFVALGICAALFFRTVSGRVIYVIIDRLLVDFWLGSVQHDVMWQQGTTRGKMLRQTPALNFHVTNINDWLGVIHIPATNTDCIIVTGSGSDIAAQRIGMMYRRNMEIADAIKKVASQQGYRIGATMLLRRRPADPFQELKMYESICMPDVMSGSWDEAGSPDGIDSIAANQAKLVLELTEEAISGDGNVTAATVWTIDREPQVSQASRRRLFGRKDQTKELVPEKLIGMHVAQTAYDNLIKAGVTDCAVLGHTEVEEHIRMGWDVFGLNSLFVTRELRDSAEGLAASKDDVVSSVQAEIWWPNKVIKRGRKYCQLDDTFHSVLLITGQPEEAYPNSYFQLHSIEVPNISIAACGEAYRFRREASLLGRGNSILEGIVESNALRLNPSQQAAIEKLEQREKELHGSRLTMHYDILVDVAASSLEELEVNVANAIREINQRGFDTTRLIGRTLQIPAMLCATTGIPML